MDIQTPNAVYHIYSTGQYARDLGEFNSVNAVKDRLRSIAAKNLKYYVVDVFAPPVGHPDADYAFVMCADANEVV